MTWSDYPCVEWGGPFNSGGYGRLPGRGPERQTHRLSFVAAGGKLTDEKPCVLHRCDNRKCYEPRHLFAGSRGDNTRDMLSKGRQNNQAKTSCKRGHPLTGENLYVSPSSGARRCRQCVRAMQRAYWARTRAR